MMMQPLPDHAARRRARGQSLVEFLILLPVLLLLVFGAIQFALIYQAKVTLNYATFMAARQGALKNAKMNNIKDGLAAGMTPLYAANSSYIGLARARAIAMIEAFNPLTTEIEIISPSQKDYDAHKGQSEGGNEIPNDNLMYRPTNVPGGADRSLQDANVLTIKVTYCFKLIVPFVNRTIYSLYHGVTGYEQVLSGEYFAETGTPTGRCANLLDTAVNAINEVPGIPGLNLAPVAAFISGIPTTIPGLNWDIGGLRIPIVAYASVRMQSPAQF